MVVYFLLAVCLIVNLINPRVFWYVDAWRYKGEKPEPSPAYRLVCRVVSAVGLLALASGFCQKL